MSRKSTTRIEKSAASTHRGGAVKGFPSSGCWINLFDPIVGELVGACDYDCAMIDMEPVSYTHLTLPTILLV